MILCARSGNSTRLLDIVKDIPLTSGSALIGVLSEKFVEELTYVRSSIDVKEKAINVLKMLEKYHGDFMIVISDSYMTYRPCIDCTLCLTYKGLITYHMIYGIMLEKGIEIPEPRPDTALTELLANIYDSEGEYTLEKTIELLGDYIYEKNVTPKHIAACISQIRDCCINIYMTVITRENINIYTRSEDVIAVLYVEPELEDYPNVKKVIETFKKCKVPTNSQYIARLGKDNVWIYQRILQQKQS
ncbi:MAG: hypothetical protein GXO10_04380 [Crenarchaeota archaeon]|nr:hypothetical protein [Thermoproteota archaeon]